MVTEKPDNPGDEFLHTALEAWLKREVYRTVHSPDFLQALALELSKPFRPSGVSNPTAPLVHPHMERKEKT